MKFWAALLLGVALSTSASARTIDKTYHKTFPASGETSLYLKHGDGNVTLSPWNKDEVDIKVVYRARLVGIQAPGRRDFTVEFEQRGEKISVIGHEPQFMGFGSMTVQEYSYTILAPAYIEINTEGVDGDVEIQGWRNDLACHIVDGKVEISDIIADHIDIRSVDGDMNLNSIDAIVNGRTVDGDIWIDDASGSFFLNCVDGDIRLEKATCSEIIAQTTDGRISVDLEPVERFSGDLHTVDGPVRVQLGGGFSAAIDVRTGDGHISSDLSPAKDVEIDENSFYCKINGGRGSLKIRTGDGDVDLTEK